MIRNAAVNVFRQALLMHSFMRLVVRVRHAWFVLTRHVEGGSLAATNRIDGFGYSLKKLGGLENVSGKPARLIRPLSSVEALPKTGKILSIGCRHEEELLYLYAYGYPLRSIRGLDLLSTSPMIDAGDMHEMPYGDSEWDGITCGFVLSYSHSPEIAAREMIRVIKPGGVIALAVQYVPVEALRELAKSGPVIGGVEDRLQGTDRLLGLFGNHVGKVFFRNDAPDPAKHGTSAVIFSVVK